MTWLSTRSERFISSLAVLFVVSCFTTGIYFEARQKAIESTQANEKALSRASEQKRPLWAKESRIMAETQTRACPECNGELVHQEGCRQCPRCGWSACG